MSTPLKDFRVPLPEHVHTWLEADAEAFNVTMQDIARQILRDWAKKKAHAYKHATKRMQANGLQMDWAWDEMEETGVARSGRK